MTSTFFSKLSTFQGLSSITIRYKVNLIPFVLFGKKRQKIHASFNFFVFHFLASIFFSGLTRDFEPKSYHFGILNLHLERPHFGSQKNLTFTILWSRSSQGQRSYDMKRLWTKTNWCENEVDPLVTFREKVHLKVFWKYPQGEYKCKH